MGKCIDILKDEFFSHLSLRFTTAAFESLPVVVNDKKHILCEIIDCNKKSFIVNLVTFPQHNKEVLKAIE